MIYRIRAYSRTNGRRGPRFDPFSLTIDCTSGLSIARTLAGTTCTLDIAGIDVDIIDGRPAGQPSVAVTFTARTKNVIEVYMSPEDLALWIGDASAALVAPALAHR
ncbi:MAG: hypothetical protein WBA46_00155 [Thermomicrobiales bacterium]